MALKQDGMHFVLCSKQGNTIEGDVLNRVCGLGIFCPRRDQGFKPLAAHLYPNIGRVPTYAPPPPTSARIPTSPPGGCTELLPCT